MQSVSTLAAPVQTLSSMMRPVIRSYLMENPHHEKRPEGGNSGSAALSGSGVIEESRAHFPLHDLGDQRLRGR